MSDGESQTGIADVWAEQPAAQKLANIPDLARRNAEYICGELEGIEFNPSPSLVPIRPIVLAAPVRSAVDSASRYLVDLIHRVCWSLSEEPADLARRVGLRREQIPLLGAGGIQHEIDYSACNGRLDVLLQGGKPVFLEANFSAANVDPVVTHFLLAVYRSLYGLTPTLHANSVGEPFEGRVRLYRKIFRDLEAPESVAIVGTTRESTVGDIRYYEAEVNYLRARGISSDLVEPAYFATPDEAKQYSIALKHFLSEYWMPLRIPLDAMMAAHADMFFLVPDSGRSLSSKLVFAWLSAGSVPLSALERSFVQEHIPWTRLAERREVEFDGRSWSLRELALRRREEFVLKPLTCCGGKGVLLGRSAEPGLWRRRVNEAVESRDHVLQRYVEADKLTMDFFDRKTGKLRSSNVTYVLGSYIVDGINAGNTIRHFPHAAPGVVNLDMGASFNVVL
jgi:hypothetical protein